MIIQRTKAGLQSARGRMGGRPRGLAPSIRKAVKDLYEVGQKSTDEVMRYFSTGFRRTLDKVLRFVGVEIKPFQKGTVRSIDKLNEMEKRFPAWHNKNG